MVTQTHKLGFIFSLVTVNLRNRIYELGTFNWSADTSFQKGHPLFGFCLAHLTSWPPEHRGSVYISYFLILSSRKIFSPQYYNCWEVLEIVWPFCEAIPLLEVSKLSVGGGWSKSYFSLVWWHIPVILEAGTGR